MTIKIALILVISKICYLKITKYMYINIVQYMNIMQNICMYYCLRMLPILMITYKGAL